MRDIHGLSAEETLELFKTLECPSLGEMSEESRGEPLRQPSLLATIISKSFTHNPLLFGKWLSKSFRPVDDSFGRGYNSLMHFGRVKR